jgi:nitrate/TMAO reductase-like tetraheme cytochrome c subunit
MQMQIKRWVLAVLLLSAATVGAGAIIASTMIYHATGTNAFCTSCHSMSIQADDPYFKKSAHRSNSKGVLASCGDCHIPKTNWFFETYVKTTSGIRDVIAELTHNFKDPKAWAEHRVKLAEETQAKLRRWDSITCRSCHDANAIVPKSEDGRTSHAMLKQGGVTCVDCHTNLVHSPVQQAKD